MRTMASLGVAALVVVGVLVIILRALGLLLSPGIGIAGSIALALIIVFTSALGSVLMALAFFGDQDTEEEELRLPPATGPRSGDARCP